MSRLLVGLAASLCRRHPMSGSSSVKLKALQQTRGYKSKCRHLDLGESRSVAYREIPGTEKPTIVYVPGLHSYSHMRGLMAQCLLRYCDINNINCFAYDHECMGESQGDINRLLFSHWVEDLLSVIDRLTSGPVVLVSLSMGGWLSLVAAQQRTERIHGMVMYAPAINYIYPYYTRHVDLLPEEIRRRLDAGDIHVNQHSYGDALLKKDFAEDSRRYEVDLSAPVKLDCPVRILHGVDDKEVDPAQSMNLLRSIATADVDLVYRKSAKHQAEDPWDIEIILNTMDRLLKDYPVKKTA